VTSGREIVTAHSCQINSSFIVNKYRFSKFDQGRLSLLDIPVIHSIALLSVDPGSMVDVSRKNQGVRSMCQQMEINLC
jgi:hypothetical protein